MKETSNVRFEWSDHGITEDVFSFYPHLRTVFQYRHPDGRYFLQNRDFGRLIGIFPEKEALISDGQILRVKDYKLFKDSTKRTSETSVEKRKRFWYSWIATGLKVRGNSFALGKWAKEVWDIYQQDLNTT